jgi:two-component system response regulator YesN
MKLLVADDQVSLHRYLDKVMDWEAMGFTDVRHAYDGEEAAAMVASFHPDILILDIHMPNLNGIESLKRVRQSGLAPKTIILSAYDEFEYARDALHLQVSHYLLKPVDAAQLRSALEELVRESGAAMRRAIGAELERVLYTGEAEAEALATIRRGFDFFGIDRFAVITCADGTADGCYARWLRERAAGRFRCAIDGRNRNGSVILVGGREELSGGQLREFVESLLRHPEAPSVSPPPVGISSIAQDAAVLPQLIAESARAAAAPAETGSRLQDTIWRIKRHIDNSYHEDLTLQRVADRFRIDKYQLCRAFKKEFGVNYWSYVMKVRMEKAAELLAGTEWKNSLIAERTGFLDESHFSRAFKKFYGIAPKEYRRRQTASRPTAGLRNN